LTTTAAHPPVAVNAGGGRQAGSADIRVGSSRRELRRRLRYAERRQQALAFLLVMPLLLFLLINFVLPITMMMVKSVDGREASRALILSRQALAEWEGKDLPGPEAARAIMADIAALKGSPALTALANRLNYDLNGLRSLVLKTARRLPPAETGEPMAMLAAIDPMWERVDVWAAVKRTTEPITSFYLLAAVDARRDVSGGAYFLEPEQGVLRDVFLRTFWISLVVTLTCLVLGYPLAYLITIAAPGWAAAMMMTILLPFWTSLLVRTSAWIVLLQTDGLVNKTLRSLGLITEPLQLVFNRTGAYIALVHVLLPLMVLPIYSIMRSIKPHTVQAAISLGATPATAFRRVYLPQTIPGIASGTLLVFVSALGFFVTPALIGGAGDQMIGYFIAHYVNDTLNWGMAAALGAILLVSTSALFLVYGRLAGQYSPKWR
jgi:putative spermidine/putrescine transport system permease protein